MDGRSVWRTAAEHKRPPACTEAGRRRTAHPCTACAGMAAVISGGGNRKARTLGRQAWLRTLSGQTGKALSVLGQGTPRLWSQYSGSAARRRAPGSGSRCVLADSGSARCKETASFHGEYAAFAAGVTTKGLSAGPVCRTGQDAPFVLLARPLPDRACQARSMVTSSLPSRSCSSTLTCSSRAVLTLRPT